MNPTGSIRRGVAGRDLSNVDALVLHQMGFNRDNDISRYDKVKSHFIILQDGQIGQLHPFDINLMSSNQLNSVSVAVEFAGNLPSENGRWWKPEKFGKNTLKQQQIDAGLFLVGHLMKEIGLRRIFAHRQASSSRGNCPGPDIWSFVGQRCVDVLGLDDGGDGFAVGSGKPIPTAWRTWGN